ncbi:MAG: hypothetical protein Q8R47_02940 [Nanoarchaeota archaeon]|nr:hypothetical protein [Nanoarchaeota archaeon]
MAAKYKPKTYVVTSAQCRDEDAEDIDSIVNQEFYATLQRYCQERDAELLVMPMAGRTAHDNKFDDEIRKYLLKRDKNLNEKIKVSNNSIRPQQIDPVTGLGRFTQSDVTTIFASPKQRFKVIPNSNDSLPKVLMTTGALTHPNYKEDRIGKIAAKDHVYGAIVVETEGAIPYHYRQLTANRNGEFVDLGVKYTPKGTEECGLEALVLGDWHVRDTDPLVRNATFEMIRELKPRRIIVHDWFNGHSVNPHEEEKFITRAMMYAQGRASIEQELRDNSKELYEMRKVAGDNTEIVVVRSNHDEFLDRYLQKGRYLKEIHNWKIGHELALACYDPGNPKLRIKNPLHEGLLRYGGIPNNVTYLERNQDYKPVMGWQLGAHGDKGGNGSRASVNGLENSYGKSISGHAHTPEILRNTFRVGTSTYLSLSYNDGPSSWMNTHGLLWGNGKVQLVNIIDGKWRRK